MARSQHKGMRTQTTLLQDKLHSVWHDSHITVTWLSPVEECSRRRPGQNEVTRKLATGLGAQDNGTRSSLRGREESWGIASDADLCQPGWSASGGGWAGPWDNLQK